MLRRLSVQQRSRLCRHIQDINLLASPSCSVSSVTNNFLPNYSRNVSDQNNHQRTFSTKNIGSVPTLDVADAMCVKYSSMDNISLVSLAKQNNYDAASEVLKRHIMSVERVKYEEANDIFREIQKSNRKNRTFHSIPYKLGIFTSMGAGLGSFPMVFDINCVSWFNHRFVTADIPEPKDLETVLEIGSWSWNWMEPPLGQISFVLLCMTFARAQLQNLGLKPFTGYLRSKRAESLVREFPVYDRDILVQFSLADTLS